MTACPVGAKKGRPAKTCPVTMEMERKLAAEQKQPTEEMSLKVWL